MQPTHFLHKVLLESCQNIHKKRMTALFDAAAGLIRHRKLSLVGIGRSLIAKAKTKHQIKRIDRLLTNKKLQKERTAFYKTTARLILGNKKRPVVLVDWAVINILRNFWIIRATVPLNGRSIILYEEVHPERLLDNPKINRSFLQTLSTLLPADCRPIIVTDAGFRNPWFKAVIELGWDFVGRVRNRTLFRGSQGKDWLGCKSLYTKATQTPAYFGEVSLSNKNSIKCHFYLFKQKPKNRICKTNKGTRSKQSTSLKHSKREREPWLLASSIFREEIAPTKIVEIYKSRMKIECSFRDYKNQRNGFSRIFDGRRQTREDGAGPECQGLYQ